MHVEKVRFPSVVPEKATSVTVDSILQECEQIFMGEKDACSKIWVITNEFLFTTSLFMLHNAIR